MEYNDYMSDVFVGVGSNVRPEENVMRAMRLLGERVRIVAISTFYCTEPIGRPQQAEYLNGVVRIETDVPPVELKYSVLRPIEEALGRRRTQDRYAPRTIDLDILVYDQLIIESEGLTLPDPDIAERDFLALGLCELVPDLLIPGMGKTTREVAAAFTDHVMRPLPGFSAQLRRDLLDEPRESPEPDQGTADRDR